MWKWMAIAMLVMSLAGCSSIFENARHRKNSAEFNAWMDIQQDRQNVESITPPPRAKTLSVSPFINPRTQLTMSWKVCDRVPTNAWFRVYQSIGTNKSIYADTRNEWLLIPLLPITDTLVSYSVTMTDGVQESVKGTKDFCPDK